MRFHNPVPLSLLLNDREIKWCRIGVTILIYSCDKDHVLAQAHGVSCTCQLWAVIIKVLNLDCYGSCGSFGGSV